MPQSAAITTTVSTKGQVILPKAIRDHHRWAAGTRLVVKDTPEGVLLTRVPLSPSTRLEDVVGILKYSGPAKTIEEMDAGVLEMARRQNARD